MTPQILTHAIDLPSWADAGALTWPTIATGLAGLLILSGLLTALAWTIRRSIRAVTAAIAAGRLTTRRVLITVAVVAALGVAGVGGARSFTAVSVKFDSPLVPLVADGMIVACTALRLAALTRGWRIPGALVTTYVFIGGTVWLNIDTAHGIADALAHALAPLAYAVLVEMLAHLLRLHLRLAQPAKPRLSALTWLTSPVITTRVWLHLSRTGADDPAAARALVQQVVRMASRLATLCPSHKAWPFDAARAARTAALQTIRDGLLSATDLAALLPATGALTPGELLALIDSAALAPPSSSEPEDVASDRNAVQPSAVNPLGAPVWAVAYLLGALRAVSTGAPVQTATRTAPPAPVHQPARTGIPDSAPAPVHPSQRTAARSETAVAHGSDERTDDELLALVRHHSATEHGGRPISQRAIRRVTGAGTPRARRLAELAGWAEPTDTPDDNPAARPEVRGQLQLVTEHGETADDNTASSDNGTDEDSTTNRELETSSNR
ncbi:DUF2637 domain-containing protein [Kribbella capetownensis]|uniref:DUF2637 domain-containing protein n=1 Tax=Kribbella capetownensis TaxID=1572659 RepID=A0A4R0K0M5_9ACTN|nr:DUF2637 domain-containing protein [Kribbella capetownensis]TCC53473.1 DUF2637 domain-containing protein [Kribbella capetownensis]